MKTTATLSHYKAATAEAVQAQGIRMQPAATKQSSHGLVGFAAV